MGSGTNKIRGRVRYMNRKTYNEFIETTKYKTFSEKNNITISYKEYMDILTMSNKKIADFILEYPLGFELPKNLGFIAVAKFKQKRNYIVYDWINTLKFKKPVPNLNFHSMGYMYRIAFYKNKRHVPLRVYFMHAHRSIKRELAKRIKNGTNKYISLDSSYFNQRFNLLKIFKNKKQWV